MSEAPSYSIATLVDISRIPEEAMPRFLAELPHIVSAVRAAREVIEGLYEATGTPPLTPAGWLDVIADHRWIDDDKGDVRSGITLRHDDGSEHRLVSVEGNYKTGKFTAHIDLPDEGAAA
jgi:hypothetical protein